MTSPRKNPTERDRPQAGIRFGGWSGYKEWAAHDFRQRTPADEDQTSAATGPTDVVIEVLPVILFEFDEAGTAANARIACRLVPPPDLDGFDDGSGHSPDEWDGPELRVVDERALVRPYVRAGGRADAKYHLEFETVLTATGMHMFWSGVRELDEDQLAICMFCDEPRSVVEIAVELDVPTGVAKVISSDAIDHGLLEVNETALVHGRLPLELLRRVHAGVAKLV